MRRVVVGTAGHIDHGKTALVGALTGIDTDRLPEEKRRGITIDLGFARLLADDVQLSLIDVPGHERFVRNMLAGASGIDAVLLVVAADESVAPQTVEHFEICRLLGVERGVIAITKADRATADMIELVQLELAELVAGTPLESAPVIVTSSKEGRGIDQLRDELIRLAPSVEAETDDRVFRLPVDRAFTIRGFGTVVTGTVVSGSAAPGSNLVVMPEALQSRVRRIEIHDSERDRAVAGDRASLNLPDLQVRDVQRGVQLVEPGTLRPSSLLTVELDLLPAAAALKDGARVRVHHLTIEAIGRVRLRAKKRLAPGGREIAQLHLDRPVTAVAGDRFVIRTYSPARTIGGGVILDPHLPRAGRKFPVEDVRQLAGASVVERAGWMARRMGARGITIEDLVAVTGLKGDRIARELASGGTLIPIGDRWLDPGAIDDLDARVVKSLEDFFAATPLSTGMPRRELVQKTFPSGLGADAGAALLERLRQRGRITVEGDVVDLPGRDKRPEGVAGSIADRVEACFSGAGLAPPGLREVQDEVGHKPKVVEGVLGFLLKEGTLVRLADGLWVHRDALDSAAARVREHRGETHDVAWFKDLFGLTRKVGIPLLEWFDANGVTKRVGDQRTIL